MFITQHWLYKSIKNSILKYLFIKAINHKTYVVQSITALLFMAVSYGAQCISILIISYVLHIG